MDRVIFVSHDDFQNSLPTTLAHLSLRDLSMETDTLSHYILTRVHTKFAWHESAKMKFLKLFLTEDSSDVLEAFLIGDIGEKCRNVAIGDMMAISGFRIEFSSKCATSLATLPFQISVCATFPGATVWVQSCDESPRNGSTLASMSAHLSPNIGKNRSAAASAVVSCNPSNTDIRRSPRKSTSSTSAGISHVAVSGPSTSKAEMVLATNSVNSASANVRRSPRKSTSNTNQSSTVGGSSSTTAATLLSSEPTVGVNSVEDNAGIGAPSVVTAAAPAVTDVVVKGPKHNDQPATAGTSKTTSPSRTKARMVEAGNTAAGNDKNQPDATAAATCAPTDPGSHYVYTKIKDIAKLNDAYVNVIGVVKFIKATSKSRGFDYSQMLSIVDESCTTPYAKLKCMLFAKEVDELPPANIGDVIRFHKLKIKEFNNEPQGQTFKGTRWILFDGTDGSRAKIKKASTQNFSFEVQHRQRVMELIQWANGEDSILSQPANGTGAPAPVPPAPNVLTSVSNVTFGSFFNLTCQVIGKCVLTDKQSILLTVWDGTRPSITLFEQDTSTVNDFASRYVADAEIVRAARGCIVHLWVYDNYFTAAERVKPGDFIKLINVHAMPHKFTEADQLDRSVPVAELSLHGGGSKFHRSLTVLDPFSPEVQRLKLVLDECRQNGAGNEADLMTLASSNSFWVDASPNNSAATVSSDCLTLTDSQLSAAVMETDDNGASPKVAASKRTSSTNQSSEGEKRRRSGDRKDDGMPEPINGREENINRGWVTPTDFFDSEEDRCLLQTATVITDHHHIVPTLLRDVLKSNVPAKFRVHVDLVKYSPTLTNPEDMVQLYCQQCQFLYASSDIPSTVGISSTDNNIVPEYSVHHDEHGIHFYACPACSQSTNGTVDASKDTVLLSYIFVLQLVIRDKTSWLSAVLTRQEAVKFFNGVEALDVLRSRRKFESIRRQLDEMCVGNTSLAAPNVDEDVEPDESETEHSRASTRRLECCLMSYTTPVGRAHQIFDTAISLS